MGMIHWVKAVAGGDFSRFRSLDFSRKNDLLKLTKKESSFIIRIPVFTHPIDEKFIIGILLLHPSYSSDLALSDYYLFSGLHNYLDGLRSALKEELIKGRSLI